MKKSKGQAHALRHNVQHFVRSSAPAAVKGPYSSSTWQTDLGGIPPPPGLSPPSASASPPLHDRRTSPHLHHPGGPLGQGGVAGSPPPGPRGGQDARVGLPPPPPPQLLQHPRLDPGNHGSGSPVEHLGNLGSPVSSRGFDGRPPPAQASLPGLPPPGVDSLRMTQSANIVDTYAQRPVRSPTRAHAAHSGLGPASGAGGSSSYEQQLLQASLQSSAFDGLHGANSLPTLPSLGVPASLDARLQQAGSMNGRPPAASSILYDGQAAAGMGAVMPAIPAMLQQSPLQPPPPPQQPPPPPPQQQQQQQQQASVQQQGSGMYSIPHSAYDSFASAAAIAQQQGGNASGRMSPPPRRAVSVAHIYDERMAMLEHDAAAAASFFNAGSGAMTASSASYGSLGLEHQSSTAAQHAQQLAAAQQHMAQLAQVLTPVDTSGCDSASSSYGGQDRARRGPDGRLC